MTSPSVIEQILDLARWAPSGDNTQPWRFEIVDALHLVVHGFDTRDHCVYDLEGHPSQISLGALFETMAIAASGHGLVTTVVRRPDSPEATPVFDVAFKADTSIVADPLIASITVRSVQRRPMRTRPLTANEKQALEAAVGSHYHILWLEGLGAKFRAARLMYSNAKLRLTMPEAYEVHRTIIEWSARYSEDRVPDQALGVDLMTTRIMRWGMKSWQRLAMVNALMGTWAPRLQMDLIPGLACAAHFVIKAKRQPQTLDDYVAAGRIVQRFWLTLTHLGLFMQPEMTPLIFSAYVKNGIRFSKLDSLHTAARNLQNRVNSLIETDSAYPVFMGRLGAGPAPQARSLRQPLERLMKQ